jgi:hypothetical protein
LLAGTALVKVVLQDAAVSERFWPYVQIDIWRVHRGGIGANVAKQVDIGQTIDPCNDLGQAASSEKVAPGSEDHVVGRSEPISIRQSDGSVLQGADNCACKQRQYTTWI